MDMLLLTLSVFALLAGTFGWMLLKDVARGLRVLACKAGDALTWLVRNLGPDDAARVLLISVCVIAVGIVTLASACLDLGNSTVGPTQVNNQNVVVPTVAPSPTPQATASTACSFAPVAVRVGPFGFDNCPNPPANTAGTLPMACTGVFTATPKDAQGKDYPDTLAIHGATPTWQASGPVHLADFAGESFNKLVLPDSPGRFTVSVTICGTTGSYSGEVR